MEERGSPSPNESPSESTDQSTFSKVIDAENLLPASHVTSHTPDTVPQTHSSYLSQAGSYIHTFILGFLALFGVVSFWVGLWNLVNNYVLGSSLWSEIVCMLLGLVLLFMANTFNTLIYSSDKDGTNTESKSKWCWDSERCQYNCGLFLLYCRCICSLIGVVMVWKGLWNILDLHILSVTIWRESIYTILGLILMLYTKTLFNNAGVAAPPSLQSQPDLDEANWGDNQSRSARFKATTFSVLELIGSRGIRRNQRPIHLRPNC